jgi:heterodisulfide reductase subunit B
MMKIGYYPGCTLKTKAGNLENSALACFKALGIECEELPRWNCCGAVYSLADDDLIHIIAPVRDLVRAAENGFDTLMTLCSMCYNTLARANDLMKNDKQKRDTINMFMDEEPDYFGQVRVVHFLDFLRDDYGFDNLKKTIKVSLGDLKVAPYYGCTLLRPREVAIDRPDNPAVFQEFLRVIGLNVVDFPSATTCCGSYQVLGAPEAALKVADDILGDAVEHGAEALALTCPLCDYNLGRKQDLMRDRFKHSREVPVYYFTQLLAIALGIPLDVHHFKLNRESSAALLKTKNLLKVTA